MKLKNTMVCTENPEKNQNTDSTKTDSPAEDDEHKDN